MRREDLEKLLGGYAAGILTDEERRQLLQAALTDQALFDSLANEEALRDALGNPETRARVRAALAQQPGSAFDRLAAWVRQPRAWALAAATTAALFIGVVAIHVSFSLKPALEMRQLAALRTSPLEPQPAAPAPASPPQRSAAKAPAVAHPRRGATRASQPFTPPVAGMLAEPKALPAPPPPPQPSVNAPGLAGGGPAALTSRELNFGGSAGSSARAMARMQNRVTAAIVTSASEIGLRYTLVRRGQDGQYFGVPADAGLAPGESARLRVQSNEAGYLYVMADKGALFTGPVQPGQPVLIDVQPGILYVILSRQPDSGPLSTLVSRTQSQLAGARIRIEKPAADRPQDEAVYVVNPDSGPDARVLAEINLNSR